MKALKEIKVTVKLVPVACDIIAEYGDYLMLRDDGQGAFVVIGKYHAVPIEAPAATPPVPVKPLANVRRSEVIAMECEAIVRVMSQAHHAKSFTPAEIGEALRVQLERHEPILPHIYSNRIQALLKSGRIHQVEHGLYGYGPPSPAKQSEAAD